MKLKSVYCIRGDSVHVKGYYKSNGTYVQPHYRSSPNSTTLDNYSTKGNVNPYTGKEGTVNPPLYAHPLSTYIPSPATQNSHPEKTLVPSNSSNSFNGIPVYEFGN
jgi:hypothetical protein